MSMIEISANNLNQQVLRTDASGMPLEWINYQDAVRLYHLEQVAFACGTALYEIHGGINALTGKQSVVEVNSIIATHGNTRALLKARERYTPPLNNPALFARDAHICLYCGKQFQPRFLSRDHVTPLSNKGQDTWNNVVTACKRCNNHKAGRTPEQSGMELLAIPFTPTHAEYVYLQGKRVLADQMQFLLAHFPRTSPLHDRLSNEVRSLNS
jgi:5-methylcytosine-specific restriction endonuclease McrA